MLNFWTNFYTLLISYGNFFQSLLLLAIRIYWGGSFLISGWGKLHHMAGVSDYFSSLGIPFPTLNAYLAGCTELIGGFCLLIGLASRLTAIPLIFVMVVALLTAHHAALINAWNDPQNLINQLPFNYLLTALIIFAFGPGKLSVDFLVQKSFFSSSQAK